MKSTSKRILLNIFILMFGLSFSPEVLFAASVVNFTGEELLGRPTDSSITVNIVPDSTIAYYYVYGTS